MSGTSGERGDQRVGGVPRPREARESTLPHPLTFFLTSAERRGVLARLDEHDATRERALLRALGVDVGRDESGAASRSRGRAAR